MANSKNVHEASDSTFESEVLGQDQLAMVDFWAEWCGPCRMLAPTVDAVADEFSGKIKVFKMNVDDNPEVPQRFNIRGIPTLLFFKGGRAVDQLVGNQPKDTIVSTIAKHT